MGTSAMNEAKRTQQTERILSLGGTSHTNAAVYSVRTASLRAAFLAARLHPRGVTQARNCMRTERQEFNLSRRLEVNLLSSGADIAIWVETRALGGCCTSVGGLLQVRYGFGHE